MLKCPHDKKLLNAAPVPIPVCTGLFLLRSALCTSLTCLFRLIHASVCHCLCFALPNIDFTYSPDSTCSNSPLLVPSCRPRDGLVHVTPDTQAHLHYKLTGMFRLVHLALTLEGGKTFQEFSPVHVCVCVIACLVGLLGNRISWDFAAITRSTVCV